MKKVSKLPKPNLGERMYEYETISRNKLMPKQPSLLKIDLRHFNNLLNQFWVETSDKHSIDRCIVDAFEEATLKICEEITNIEFAFYQRNEVLILLRDEVYQKQEQYFKGDIQKIVSLISSKFTYWFNIRMIETLKEREIYLCEPAFFTAVVYNIPNFEIINNFIFKQQESLKNFKDSIYANGIFFYKIPIAEMLSNETKNKLLQLDISVNPVKEKLKWIIDINPPLLTENRYYIEKFLK